MPKQFATSVVLDDAAERVLLILRQDFRIWALPGGGIEPGETPDQAAVRETLEETGYEVAIDRLVGSYFRPQLNDTRYVYRVHITGGQPIQNGPETVEVRWFPIHALPVKTTPLVPGIIQDTLAQSGEPFQKEQRLPAWQIIYMRLRVWLRDGMKRLRASR
jgi:8-oxo-dGTP pyrophosphatase MutT (NUDIX family)